MYTNILSVCTHTYTHVRTRTRTHTHTHTHTERERARKHCSISPFLFKTRASPASCLHGQNTQPLNHSLTNTHTHTHTHPHAQTHRTCLTQASLASELAIIYSKSQNAFTLLKKVIKDVWANHLQQFHTSKPPFAFCWPLRRKKN